jgi:hypothetical protein
MKTLKPNGLAILQAKDGQFPKQAISLLEIMREFIAYNVCQWDGLIEGLIERTKKPAGTLISKKEAKRIKHNFDIYFGKDCKIDEMGWEEVELRVFALRLILDITIGIKKFPNKKALTAEMVNNALDELHMAFLNELASRKFVMIDKEKSKFLEQKNLFGKQVNKAFPLAKDEIRAAGNCLAMDFNTAAVFHLMRVAELGMRALARHLKVKAKKNAIDTAGWTEIIKHIGDATAARWQKLPKAKPARRKAVAFLKLCEVSADELNVFKEVWRNNVMHAGLPNNEHEAHGVYIRVRDFMQRLSTQVLEANN